MCAYVCVCVCIGTRVTSVEGSQHPDALPTGAVLNLDDRPTLTSQARGVAAGVADAAAAAATATAAAASGVAAAASSAAAAIRDPGAAAAVADGAVKAVKGAAAVVTGDPQPTASKAAGAAADATASYASSHSSAASGDQQSGSQYVGPSTLEVDIVLWTAGCSPTTKSEREGFPFPTSSRGSVRTVRDVIHTLVNIHVCIWCMHGRLISCMLTMLTLSTCSYPVGRALMFAQHGIGRSAEGVVCVCVCVCRTRHYVCYPSSVCSL